MAVSSAGSYVNSLHLSPDRWPRRHHFRYSESVGKIQLVDEYSLNVYGPDAVCDAQPMVSMYWRQQDVDLLVQASRMWTLLKKHTCCLFVFHYKSNITLAVPWHLSTQLHSGERTGCHLLWSTTLLLPTGDPAIRQPSFWSALSYMVSDELFPDSSCRANSCKWGLVQSLFCDCGHVPMNKIWRWTPQSGWWCNCVAEIYRDCSTCEINNCVPNRSISKYHLYAWDGDNSHNMPQLGLLSYCGFLLFLYSCDWIIMFLC